MDRLKVHLMTGAIKHEALFPKATLDSQIRKVEEELKEAMTADIKGEREHYFRELADVLITCWGVYRFCPKTAYAIATTLFASGMDSLFDEANRKWEVNEKRTWKFNTKKGVYEHDGKDGNE